MATGWKRSILAVLLGAAVLAGGRASAEPEGGPGSEGGSEKSFIPPEAHVCLACHTIDRDARHGADAAPPLWNVVGREPSVKGVKVDRWTPEALERWLANPRAMAPETTSRFPGYSDPEARERVIDFLKRL
ncbi:MAG TPA: hypothetical protein VKA48_03580 [Gammaproteobacteria bacterium]|nr:hypothetical protein [Gammaproteobacteria bacterium]